MQTISISITSKKTKNVLRMNVPRHFFLASTNKNVEVLSFGIRSSNYNQRVSSGIPGQAMQISNLQLKGTIYEFPIYCKFYRFIRLGPIANFISDVLK